MSRVIDLGPLPSLAPTTAMQSHKLLHTFYLENGPQKFDMRVREAAAAVSQFFPKAAPPEICAIPDHHADSKRAGPVGQPPGSSCASATAVTPNPNHMHAMQRHPESPMQERNEQEKGEAAEIGAPYCVLHPGEAKA